MRRAKIVCTLGPATATQEMLEKLLLAGMDVARLNFSHGTHEAHAQSIAMLRAASLKVRKADIGTAVMEGIHRGLLARATSNSPIRLAHQVLAPGGSQASSKTILGTGSQPPGTSGNHP